MGMGGGVQYLPPGLAPGAFTPQFAGMMNLAQPMEFLPHSKKVKLVGWAIMQILVGICDTETKMVAPAENVLSQTADRSKRFILFLTAMSLHVEKYADGTASDTTNLYIEARVVRPFLEMLHREFTALNMPKLQLVPTVNNRMIEMSRIVGETIYQLHAFTSSIHEFFFPPCFKYEDLNIDLSAQLANAAIKCLLRTLFSREYDQSLTHSLLFTKIAELMEHLAKITPVVYLEEKADQQIYLKVAEVVNLIAAVVRKAALSSVTMFGEAFPIPLVSNKAYQAHIDMLTMLPKL